MKPIKMLRRAERELTDATAFITAARRESGDEFAEHVRFTLDSISKQPRVHEVIQDKVRKAVIRKFSYCIYYREEADCVRVIAVHHTSRDPRNWQSRI
jgi:toxin ParE1/3/4